MTRAASIPLEARSPPSLLRTRPARTPPFTCHGTRAPLLPAVQRTSPLRLPTPQPPTQYTFTCRLSHTQSPAARLRGEASTLYAVEC
eukprot:scaffold24181_cov38-Phaeocystis_antarctica.AAC.1